MVVGMDRTMHTGESVMYKNIRELVYACLPIRRYIERNDASTQSPSDG